MKLLFGAGALIAGLILGHIHQAPMCTDPNTNMPIECSVLNGK